MKNYKDLIVWQKAHALVLFIYRHTTDFPKPEQYNLTSQLRRAATSIPTNLAEDCGKFSQLDFANFVQIALGSANEVEYLALLSNELGYLKNDRYKNLDFQVNEVRAMLMGMITKVRKDLKIKV
ncbi:MAG: four helix bundle protein [Cyclobacteriaceae bacterium]